jgi:hypothetical protein
MRKTEISAGERFNLEHHCTWMFFWIRNSIGRNEGFYRSGKANRVRGI